MVDLFAGIPVSDYESAVAWYGRLLGVDPSFLPNGTEAVWEVGEHRYVFIEVRPAHAGCLVHGRDQRLDHGVHGAVLRSGLGLRRLAALRSGPTGRLRCPIGTRAA